MIERIRDVAWNYLGLARNEAGLRQGLAEIEALRGVPLAVSDEASLVKALEARNLLQAAELVVHAALTRTESRGQHRRTDFPARDDAEWVRWVALERGADGPRVSTAPIRRWRRRRRWRGVPEQRTGASVGIGSRAVPGHARCSATTATGPRAALARRRCPATTPGRR